MSKPKVFISYSHVDEKRWKNRLQKHLKVLERHGSLSFWDDRRIAVGQEWRAEIKAALDSADAAILLTLRADFMGQAQSFSPAFSQLLDDGIVSLRPLTRADLEAVITGPARHSGLEYEPGLVNSILQEVAAQPDSLPLLEYALKEMWRKRQSRVMGHALYEAVGKVEGAISQHADAVLHALPEGERVLALRALTRLVRVAGEDGEADTRLRLPWSIVVRLIAPFHMRARSNMWQLWHQLAEL